MRNSKISLMLAAAMMAPAILGMPSAQATNPFEGDDEAEAEAEAFRKRVFDAKDQDRRNRYYKNSSIQREIAEHNAKIDEKKRQRVDRKLNSRKYK